MSSRKDLNAGAPTPTLPGRPPHARRPHAPAAQAKPAPGHAGALRPAAPPPYRPQPTPKVLQTKPALPQGTAPGAQRLAPNHRAAPPHANPVKPPNVPRTAPACVQPKPALPPRATPNAPAPPAVRAPRFFAAVQLNPDKIKKQQKRKKDFKKGISLEEKRREREKKVLATQRAKRHKALMERRKMNFPPKTHTMELRYPPRDSIVRKALDEEVVEKYVLLALQNFVKIVGDAGKFVKKTAVVNATRLDNLAFGVNAKFATKKSPFPLQNCVAVAERQDGVTIIAANSMIPPKAREQLDIMFPKGFILVECKEHRLQGLHCEIKLWEDVDDFETTPFGVQQLCCLYCAAQLVAVGVTNFAGCHGQTYDYTNISTVVVGQPNACRRLLGAKVYAWYSKLKTDEQYQFICALEGGGFLQKQKKIRPTKLGSMTYSEEAKKIHEVKTKKPMRKRTFFDEGEDYEFVEEPDDVYYDVDVEEEDLTNGIQDVPLWPQLTPGQQIGPPKLFFKQFHKDDK